MVTFPRTTVGGVSLPRMLIGSNWLLGYSHTGAAADGYINKINRNREAQAAIFEVFLKYGVDAVMAPVMANPVLWEGAKLAEERTGKKMILIDTPILNVDERVTRRGASSKRRRSLAVRSASRTTHRRSSWSTRTSIRWIVCRTIFR